MTVKKPEHANYWVDPDLVPLLEAMRGFAVDAATLPELRKNFGIGAAPAAEAGAATDVEMSRHVVPGKSGNPDVSVAVFDLTGPFSPRGALVHMHGGGFVLGDPYALEAPLRLLAMQLKCRIVSVDYRLAPETRFPGAVEDAYTALAWTFREADKVGVKPERIGVMGESAGGGLAASLALLARDRGEYPIAFQHLVYPMLDDRTCVSLDPNPFSGDFVWNRDSNRFGWESLLGVEPGRADVSPYAAAARAEDLTGLPPTFILTGALDLFVDEDIEYARRLVRAGVPTELHVYPGAYHGFDLEPAAAVTVKAYQDRLYALQRALR